MHKILRKSSEHVTKDDVKNKLKFNGMPRVTHILF